MALPQHKPPPAPRTLGPLAEGGTFTAEVAQATGGDAADT